MNTSDRIEKIIKTLGYNNSSFAKKISVSATTVDGYIKGRRNTNGELIISKPNFDVIKKICLEFNINAGYILGLSDDMYENLGESLKSTPKETILDYIINHKNDFRDEPKIDAVTALFYNFEQQRELQKLYDKLESYEKRLEERETKN